MFDIGKAFYLDEKRAAEGVWLEYSESEGKFVETVEDAEECVKIRHFSSEPVLGVLDSYDETTRRRWQEGKLNDKVAIEITVRLMEKIVVEWRGFSLFGKPLNFNKTNLHKTIKHEEGGVGAKFCRICLEASMTDSFFGKKEFEEDEKKS